MLWRIRKIYNNWTINCTIKLIGVFRNNNAWTFINAEDTGLKNLYIWLVLMYTIGNILWGYLKLTVDSVFNIHVSNCWRIINYLSSLKVIFNIAHHIDSIVLSHQAIYNCTKKVITLKYWTENWWKVNDFEEISSTLYTLSILASLF